MTVKNKCKQQKGAASAAAKKVKTSIKLKNPNGTY